MSQLIERGEVVAFGGRLRLSQRFGITVLQTPNATIGPARSNVFVTPAPTFPLRGDQAFRLVAYNAKVADGGNTGLLTLNAAQMFMAGAFNTIYRQGPVTYPVGLLAALGVTIQIDDTPLISNTDWESSGTPMTTIAIGLSADVTNSGAATPVTLFFTTLVEVYDIIKTGTR
jgi:hypothetical protein